VPPIATDPKRIDAGANEIVAAVVVLCWPEPGLEALVRPMHPEMEIVEESRRIRAATETAFLPVESARSARSWPRPNHLFMSKRFIACDFGVWKEGRTTGPSGKLRTGEYLHLAHEHGGNRRAAV
jgi:hypothetical protein